LSHCIAEHLALRAPGSARAETIAPAPVIAATGILSPIAALRPTGAAGRL